MELGLIKKVDLDSEMQQSYLDYAMSVIVSRALPDARDGLKPVQRRILYAMYDMGLRSDSAYKKSARIVGEVLGKYHPHGDMAVYESMARMAQDFSMRYPLVDGQGNFGSVDGDPPAAMRYTEARLANAAMENLNQIDKNTVDFIGNFDQSLSEPVVLPAAIPNLLVNGATGIAVGMATNIPPHNLSEVVDALVYMLGRWEKLDDITVQDLLGFVHGPDFPTGGVIIQDTEGETIMSAYGTGRGRLVVQARAHLEEMVRGRNRIIVTELPYQVNKATLIERIAELVRGETLEGIADLRDESDRQGMRIVIELSKTADPEKILRDLYRHTPMQTTFGIILLALVDGEPRLLSLKQALRVYLDHRLTVVRRRSEYELEKAKQRAHILEGLLVALKNLDEVINLIRNSPDADQARQRLIKRFKLSEIQAQAILDLPLRRLASLERKKIELEYKEVVGLIKSLEELLRSPKKMRQVVTDELLEMKGIYGDPRRTLIIRLKEGASATSLLTTTDVMPAEDVWVGVTTDGNIARAPAGSLASFIEQTRPTWLVHTDTHGTLYLVSDQGKAAAIHVHAVPEAAKSPEGVSIYRASPLEDHDRLAALFALPAKLDEAAEQYVLTVTKAGQVKKSQTSELPGPSAHTFQLSKVNDRDALVDARITDGKADLILATAQGMAIRFGEEDIRPMGLVAAGVAGIKLAATDVVIGMEILPEKASYGELFFIASNGKAKRVSIREFPSQARYGQGVQAWKLSQNLRLSGIRFGGKGEHEIVHYGDGSVKVIRAGDAPIRARAAQGETPAILKGIGGEVLGITPFADGAAGDESEPPKRTRTAAKPKPLPEPADGKVKKAATPAGAAKNMPVAKKVKTTITSAEPIQKTATRKQVEPAAKATASKEGPKDKPLKAAEAPAQVKKQPATRTTAKVQKPVARKTTPAPVTRPVTKTATKPAAPAAASKTRTTGQKAQTPGAPEKKPTPGTKKPKGK